MSEASHSGTASKEGAGGPSAPELQGSSGSASAEKAAPSIRVLSQALRNLSFERPHLSQSPPQGEEPPSINVTVNANARPLTDNDFEVELYVNAKAVRAEAVIYEAELDYAGVFRLEGFPTQLIHPAVLIECPRLLFPFVRQILADVTRQGGAPPLNLDPIDFAAMYQRRLQQQDAGGSQVST